MNRSNITIAIVEDETIFRVLVKKNLEEIIRNVPLSFTLKEYSSGVDFLQEGRTFDIVFMDIEMPDMSGLETAEKYREYCSGGILIFLTAYEEYIKQGYKVNAFRYLGKHDDMEDFSEAVMSALLILQEKRKVRMQLVNGGEIYLSLEDIVYVEAQARLIMVHTKSEILPVRGKISELTDELESQGFYLIHRSYLVNMKYVRSCIANEVMLSTMESIPLSERRYNQFKTSLFAFQMENNT